MIRRPGPEALASLHAAATIGDAALDLALMRVGILPPADLDEIRSYLAHPSWHVVPRTNRVGHVELDVFDHGVDDRDQLGDERPVARILNDGQVLAFAAA